MYDDHSQPTDGVKDVTSLLAGLSGIKNAEIKLPSNLDSGVVVATPHSLTSLNPLFDIHDLSRNFL